MLRGTKKADPSKEESAAKRDHYLFLAYLTIIFLESTLSKVLIVTI